MADGPGADESGFLQWLALRLPQLRRKAYLLTGSWHAADDLVQESLVSAYAVWPRIASMANRDGYVQKIMVNRFIDERRRPWRRERPVAEIPDSVDDRPQSAYRVVEELDSPLSRALVRLPATQRAVLMLRYTDDLTVAEIASQLDVREGTVKSRLTRGVEALRRALEADQRCTLTRHPASERASEEAR